MTRGPLFSPSLQLLVVSVIVGASGCSSPSGTAGDRADEKDATAVFLGDEFVILAHRGGSLLAPENTVEAFTQGLASGADALEMDVQATADGVLVVMHDTTVDRTTDGKGAVAEMTLAEIQALDAGFRFTPDEGKAFPFRGKGIVVPTFQSVLEQFPNTRLSVELKATDPAVVAEALRLVSEAGMADRVLVMSFLDEVAQVIRETNPNILTALAFNESAFLLAPEVPADCASPAPIVHSSGAGGRHWRDHQPRVPGPSQAVRSEGPRMDDQRARRDGEAHQNGRRRHHHRRPQNARGCSV